MAQSQRKSDIFNTDNNHDNSSPKKEKAERYRRFLQQQMDDDRQYKLSVREKADLHPLEEKMNRVSLKKKEIVPADPNSGYFIGVDERFSKDRKKQAQRDYREQLEADTRQINGNPTWNDDLSKRKSVTRKISSDVVGAFNIGQDEALVRQKKREQASEFYRQERARLSLESSLKSHVYQDNDSQQSGFFIGADEREAKEQKARQRLVYKDSLDQQKFLEDERKAYRNEMEQMELRSNLTSKPPYSRY